jgi:hypothetical protein
LLDFAKLIAPLDCDRPFHHCLSRRSAIFMHLACLKLPQNPV